MLSRSRWLEEEEEEGTNPSLPPLLLPRRRRRNKEKKKKKKKKKKKRNKRRTKESGRGGLLVALLAQGESTTRGERPSFSTDGFEAVFFSLLKEKDSDNLPRVSSLDRYQTPPLFLSPREISRFKMEIGKLKEKQGGGGFLIFPSPPPVQSCPVSCLFPLLLSLGLALVADRYLIVVRVSALLSFPTSKLGFLYSFLFSWGLFFGWLVSKPHEEERVRLNRRISNRRLGIVANQAKSLIIAIALFQYLIIIIDIQDISLLTIKL